MSIIAHIRGAAGVLLAVTCLGFTGCESVRNDFGAGVREKFSGPSYKVRVFTGESRAVFDAAVATAGQLGFRITRSGAAQGVIEGVSGLASDAALRGTRQRTIKVRLETTADGSIEVGVLFTEVVEDDFNKGAGQGTETSLRDHPLYESFWAGMSSQLVR
ncbi:hypothetical protein [Rariglobus hedericola]|uniref:Uncharacterized protein n=1 Tax=Rariglobus hedericola TaxID=2597822 RepID=A0A556QQB5_9BACT|nr:hypothetical protein [Rariglobus hedericola]TSJ78830.1 hypothetical protein FPL22_05850 [Rariglobus hedericola]